MSSADLAARAAGGDREAFGQLLGRHLPAARRLARSVLRQSADADDAVQNAAFSAWRNVRRYDPARPFAPWFMRLVLNAAADLRRRRKVRRTEPLMEAASTGDSPERDTERALLRTRLDAALRELPERQRVAVVLFDAEGYSHADIARILGIPEGTVRSDVFHARRSLRQRLSHQEEE